MNLKTFASVIALMLSATAMTAKAAPTSSRMTEAELFKAVGGEFSYEIPNFKGFTQETPDWC
jgi:hypothetical protein